MSSDISCDARPSVKELFRVLVVKITDLEDVLNSLSEFDEDVTRLAFDEYLAAKRPYHEALVGSRKNG